MTEPQTLESKLETRQIPRFDIPTTKVREDFHGCRTEVRRATCDRASVSMHRLLTILGPTLLKLVSWDDQTAPMPNGKTSVLAELLDLDITKPDELKGFVLLHALPHLKEQLAKMTAADVLFHVDNLIVGHLSIDGVSIKTRAELDRTGITLTALSQLVLDALTVNYFPTFAAPATQDGSDEAAASPKEPTASRKNRARTTSSGKGGTVRAGRSVRTRKSSR